MYIFFYVDKTKYVCKYAFYWEYAPLGKTTNVGLSTIV